jgi:OOP family OmpA-OmpF porin
MKRFILGGLLAAAAVGCGSAQAADVNDDTGAWYLSPMAQYTLLDTKRISRDNVGYQIGIGKDFAPNWAAELDASIGSFKIPGSGASQKLYGYSVDALYKFFPSSFFRPYLIGGFGVMEDSIGGHTEADHSPLAEGGIGLLTGIGSQTGATRLQFRTEAKYRTEFINARYFGPKQPGDVLLSAGIQVMFGAPVPEPPKPVVIPPKLDSDGDGVTDDIDRCPNTPAGAKVDQFGCEFDQDGDGVVDRLDQCPDTPHGTPVDAKGCPLDSDGDGVPDTIDKCPNTPKGDKVDSVGCTIKDEIKLHGVNFATDSAELVPASDVILSYGADTLKKYPNLVIEVRGHTDSRGSKKHNLLLSQRRAESVMRYLKEHGVTNTMTAKGYGQENPIADNRTEEGRLENRRVTLRIISGF